MTHERIVLARRADGFVPYRWTGAEPPALDDADVAVALGAQWEGDELVTYDHRSLSAQIDRWTDEWQTDDD
jgi:hypothetical protein